MSLVTYALVTLANTKSFLGITSSTQDDLIELLINMATDTIESMTGVRFKQTTYTQETYDGTGCKELTLKHFPIISFTKLEYNSAYNNSSSWEDINSEDYWTEESTGILTKTTNFSPGKENYRATYSAGYTTIPYDIQYACMQLVSEFMNRRDKAGVKSESLGDHSITMTDIAMQDKMVMGIINIYRDQPLCS